MKKVELDLDGLDGNALVLIGAFAKAARSQGFDKTYINEVRGKCMSGDYNNVLQTLMDHTTPSG